MKKGTTLFLKGIILLIGGVVLALCVTILPIGLMTDKTGMFAPIIIGMYVAAIPFFVALYQAFKLLKLIDTNNAFSLLAVEALKKIKYCAAIISTLYAVGMPYIFTVADKDDAPGVVAIALVIVFASVVIAVFAALLEKLLHNVIEIKSENELTV